jgi:tetratricopeptide (TPR) repeat protein
MNDYYRILGVSETASQSEIKRAYRKKAKELHPDLSAKNSAEFRAVVTAYKTLSDHRSRLLFDAQYAFARRRARPAGSKVFDYRTWLVERYDEQSRSRLIVFDLLHELEEDAVDEYKKLIAENPLFTLARYFTREESMDYGFILAEELVNYEDYYAACVLLEKILLLEKTFSFFKVFSEEVKDFARTVFIDMLEGSVSDEYAIDLWKRALELALGDKADEELLCKIADAYTRLGDDVTAHLCAEEAVRLQQRGKKKKDSLYDSLKK